MKSSLKTSSKASRVILSKSFKKEIVQEDLERKRKKNSSKVLERNRPKALERHSQELLQRK